MKYAFLPVTLFIFGFLISMGIYKWQNQIRVNENVLISPLGENIITPTFSVENAPTQSLKGKIISMSGNLGWGSRIATMPAVLITPVPIQQGEELIASDDGKLMVNFDNVGTFTMSPKSDLNVIQTLPANLVFEQNQGMVQYNVTGSSPFSVRSYQLLTTVTSGSLNINIDSKQPTISLHLKDGNATLAYNDSQFVSHTIMLHGGEEFVFDRNGRDGSIR